MSADPKRAPRIRDSDLMRLLKREYDCCEVTGRTGRLHLHHGVLKSQGGDDVRANIICLDMSLHEAYHRHDPEARRRLAAYVRLRRPDFVSYLRFKLGEEPAVQWMESHLTP